MFRRLTVLFFLAFALAAPAAAQDAADAIVRLNRLESQFRQMSGQIEQLQFENRQLKEQLRKFQEDVEFRFQEGRGGSRPAPSTTTPARPAQPQAQPSTQPQRRSDLFDPSENPDAPGAPRPLGSTPPSAPLAEAPGDGMPMELPGGRLAGIGELIEQDEQSSFSDPAMDAGGRTAAIPSGGGRPGPSVAATSVADPRAEFNAAYVHYTQRQYDQAEMGFRRFLQSNPRDRLVPEATFWLGETYLQRSRFREAAEQFLNVSAEHPDADKAPDALLRLGVSLNGLGARDRACAVFAELDRKYPQAPAPVRQASEREQKRIKCS